MTPRLPREFFARPALEVAPDLLGRILVRIAPTGERMDVRIVETEAYEHHDPASHAFAGPTARNAVMFEEPGHLYVYFVYGMHWCANVVTGARGEGSAVLLRGGEPGAGLEVMLRNRGGRSPVATGPGRLAQALGLGREDNGLDLVTSSTCWVEPGHAVSADMVAVGPRIGITRAAELPWRFWERGGAFVSKAPARSRPGRGMTC